MNIIGRNNRITTIQINDTYKDIFLKILIKDLFSKLNGKFTKKNMIIINDSLVKHILNDLKNVLLLVS